MTKDDRVGTSRVIKFKKNIFSIKSFPYLYFYIN